MKELICKSRRAVGQPGALAQFMGGGHSTPRQQRSLRAAMPKKDLVLAEAWGYPLATYSSYIVSLRATGFEGDIKILGPQHAVSANIRRLCAAWRVELVDVPTPKKPLVERFGHFAEHCTTRRYRRCIATDFRDVFFQANPFDWLGGRPWATPDGAMPALVLPLEPFAIGTCDVGRHPITGELTRPGNVYGTCVNQRAVQGCMTNYGLNLPFAAFTALASQRVICSGVVAGTPLGFAALAHELVPTGLRCSRGRSDLLMDQAALNIFAYKAASAAHQLPRHVAQQRLGLRRIQGRDAAPIIWKMPTQPTGPAWQRTVPAAAAAAASPYLILNVSVFNGTEALPVALEPQGSGFANTLGVIVQSPNRSVSFVRRQVTRDGIVLNHDKVPSPIVHQFDRLLKWYEAARDPNGYAGFSARWEARLRLLRTAERTNTSSLPREHVRYKLRLRAVDEATALGRTAAGLEPPGRGYNADAGDSDSWIAPA